MWFVVSFIALSCVAPERQLLGVGRNNGDKQKNRWRNIEERGPGEILRCWCGFTKIPLRHFVHLPNNKKWKMKKVRGTDGREKKNWGEDWRWEGRGKSKALWIMQHNERVIGANCFSLFQSRSAWKNLFPLNSSHQEHNADIRNALPFLSSRCQHVHITEFWL